MKLLFTITAILSLTISSVNANEGKALYECTKKIAKYYGISSEAANIPVPSYSNTDNNEFFYSWPKGNFNLVVLGKTVPLSASCNGILSPLKLQYVSVNGKEVYNSY